MPLPLAVFKAAQLLEIEPLAASFTSFTAVDLETTDRLTDVAEVVEIAAVRVRDSGIVETFSTLVKPGVASTAGAAAAHKISEEELAGAPPFAEVWPRFREFCGSDVIVAHNGYDFDFPVLRRMTRELGVNFDLVTFDTLPLATDLFPTSRKLVDLARHFGIDTGQSHRALDDTVALARVLVELSRMKLERARKTALINLLDQLGVGLALCKDEELTPEARTLRSLARFFSLGPHSNCLEFYEQEQGDDSSFATVDEIVEVLGGEKLRERLRTVKSADERYPVAMGRLRRLIADLPAGSLDDQLTLFLERVALSQKSEGVEPERDRVNLLTLHSTKGLEFSRVYIVGAEDAQLPGGTEKKAASKEEIEEARRLLYVGLTRTKDRLTITHVQSRQGKAGGGHRFLDEMDLKPELLQ
jgi:DNA polymerase III epsilon subunit-like protein